MLQNTASLERPLTTTGSASGVSFKESDGLSISIYARGDNTQELTWGVTRMN